MHISPVRMITLPTSLGPIVSRAGWRTTPTVEGGFDVRPYVTTVGRIQGSVRTYNYALPPPYSPQGRPCDDTRPSPFPPKWLVHFRLSSNSWLLSVSTTMQSPRHPVLLLPVLVQAPLPPCLLMVVQIQTAAHCHHPSTYPPNPSLETST